MTVKSEELKTAYRSTVKMVREKEGLCIFIVETRSEMLDTIDILTREAYPVLLICDITNNEIGYFRYRIEVQDWKS